MSANTISMRERLSTALVLCAVLWEWFWGGPFGAFFEWLGTWIFSVAVLAIFIKLTRNSFGEFGFAVAIIGVFTVFRVTDRRYKK